MSNLLNVEGKEFTTATAAAKQLGYTKDYLLLLIKDGKVEGRKIGNKWFVHVPSAERFFRQAAISKVVRRRRISLERKSELERHVRARVGGSHKAAVLETLAILIIGLSLGATGYLGSVSETASAGSSLAFLERLAISFHGLFAPEEVRTDFGNTDIAVPTTTATTSVATERPSPAMIVAPAESFTEDSVDALKESFSDEVNVTVDPNDSHTGIIVPVFKSGPGEPYRFLLVPMASASSSETQ
ncbi:MAG TPA: hypothetical protein VFS75_02315 [Candidatus Paceibacterota bacterium]|nr:hypothetical protein [Candidatus Paceibacterota bacterium]